MRNAISIDVEDFFQVAAFRHQIRPENWQNWPSRVTGNVHRILDWLDIRGVRATFFILGWVARRHPDLVRAIDRRGHEIASHGFWHQLIYDIGPKPFREDIRSGKRLLEDLCGRPVVGYRAPTYSITGRSLWALDILIEEGFTYDSSIYPIIHDHYGIPGSERFPHVLSRPAGLIREFPISTVRLGGSDWNCRIPIGGGGYLRLFPAPFLYWAFARLNHQEKRPGILYFHPWEIDPDQPRVQTGWKSRLRHYLNLEKTFDRLDYLVQRLSFAPVGEILEDALPEWAPARSEQSSAPAANWNPMKIFSGPTGRMTSAPGEVNGKTINH